MPSTISVGVTEGGGAGEDGHGCDLLHRGLLCADMSEASAYMVSITSLYLTLTKARRSFMVGVSSSSSGVRICSMSRNFLMVSTRASCLFTRSISLQIRSCTSVDRQREAKLVKGTFCSWANWATVSWSIMTRQERNLR